MTFVFGVAVMFSLQNYVIRSVDEYKSNLISSFYDDDDYLKTVIPSNKDIIDDIDQYFEQPNVDYLKENHMNFEERGNILINLIMTMITILMLYYTKWNENNNKKKKKSSTIMKSICLILCYFNTAVYAGICDDRMKAAPVINVVNGVDSNYGMRCLLCQGGHTTTINNVSIDPCEYCAGMCLDVKLLGEGNPLLCYVRRRGLNKRSNCDSSMATTVFTKFSLPMMAMMTFVEPNATSTATTIIETIPSQKSTETSTSTTRKSIISDVTRNPLSSSSSVTTSVNETTTMKVGNTNSTTNANNNNNINININNAALIGGSIGGGVVLLLIISTTVLIIVCRTRHQNNIQSNNDDALNVQNNQTNFELKNSDYGKLPTAENHYSDPATALAINQYSNPPQHLRTSSSSTTASSHRNIQTEYADPGILV